MTGRATATRRPRAGSAMPGESTLQAQGGGQGPRLPSVTPRTPEPGGQPTRGWGQPGWGDPLWAAGLRGSLGSEIRVSALLRHLKLPYLFSRGRPGKTVPLLSHTHVPRTVLADSKHGCHPPVVLTR